MIFDLRTSRKPREIFQHLTPNLWLNYFRFPWQQCLPIIAQNLRGWFEGHRTPSHQIWSNSDQLICCKVANIQTTKPTNQTENKRGARFINSLPGPAFISLLHFYFTMYRDVQSLRCKFLNSWDISFTSSNKQPRLRVKSQSPESRDLQGNRNSCYRCLSFLLNRKNNMGRCHISKTQLNWVISCSYDQPFCCSTNTLYCSAEALIWLQRLFFTL